MVFIPFQLVMIVMEWLDTWPMFEWLRHGFWLSGY